MICESTRPGIALFDGGPPLRVEEWLHLRRAGERHVTREAMIAGFAAWLPLALLAAARGDLVQAGAAGSFLMDAAVHARYLVAVPVLILAESVCIPRLSALARHFVNSGLIADVDRPKFDEAVASTLRLRDATVVEVAIVLISYAIAGLLIYKVPAYLTPAWFLASDGSLGGITPAGWWHMLVSLPVLLVLLFGWIWRVLLWARFLWLMSRLDLRLLPSHPDRAGGLRFAGHSLRAFSIAAFGISAILAGGVVNRIVAEGVSIFTFRHLIGVLVLAMLVVFAAPLLAFSGKLLAHWQRGILEYGRLANYVGQRFERTWLDRTQPFTEDPLEAQAFSATTDLYQVVANVYAMRFVPVDAPSVIVLVVATLAPFLPALLLSAPLDEMLRDLAGLLI